MSQVKILMTEDALNAFNISKMAKELAKDEAELKDAGVFNEVSENQILLCSGLKDCIMIEKINLK